MRASGWSVQPGKSFGYLMLQRGKHIPAGVDQLIFTPACHWHLFGYLDYQSLRPDPTHAYPVNPRQLPGGTVHPLHIDREKIPPYLAAYCFLYLQPIEMTQLAIYTNHFERQNPGIAQLLDYPQGTAADDRKQQQS